MSSPAGWGFGHSSALRFLPAWSDRVLHSSMDSLRSHDRKAALMLWPTGPSCGKVMRITGFARRVGPIP